jgi:deoxyribose-phosphate aldolase
VYHRGVSGPSSIALGADHNGFELKQRLVAQLRARGHALRDCGTTSPEPVDFPPIAEAVARLVGRGECRFGVVIDGLGIGSAMAANKVPGVRAAVCHDVESARSAREHNDANVLALGSGRTDAAAATAIVDAFLSSACTVERYRKRVEMISALERNESLSGDDVRRITERVRELLRPGVEPSRPALAPEQLAALIDHTLLRPEASRADIEKLCAEAREHSFYSVCINPAWVPLVRGLLHGTAVKVCCVVGFPLGAQSTEIKVLEARRAIREGAREVDMVINIGALKSHDDELVFRDIRAVIEVCKEARALSKVILETTLLDDEEKVRACRLAMRAGADFVKTSTGFSSGGATVEDVELMARTVASRRLGVKASGGIRSLADALRMVQAGATRLGTSSSVKIMAEARAAAGKG